MLAVFPTVMFSVLCTYFLFTTESRDDIAFGLSMGKYFLLYEAKQLLLFLVLVRRKQLPRFCIFRSTKETTSEFLCDKNHFIIYFFCRKKTISFAVEHSEELFLIYITYIFIKYISFFNKIIIIF